MHYIRAEKRSFIANVLLLANRWIEMQAHKCLFKNRSVFMIQTSRLLPPLTLQSKLEKTIKQPARFTYKSALASPANQLKQFTAK